MLVLNASIIFKSYFMREIYSSNKSLEIGSKMDRLMEFVVSWIERHPNDAIKHRSRAKRYCSSLKHKLLRTDNNGRTEEDEGNVVIGFIYDAT